MENAAADNLEPIGSIDDSREAFMAAIVKLADDEAFRRSFLTHYQLWLHPPMLVMTGPDGAPIDLSKFDLSPGAMNFVTEDEAAALSRVVTESFGR